MKPISLRSSIIQRLAGFLAVTCLGISLPVATAQGPRLKIGLDYPSALSSVGSVLAAPSGNIVVNHDGFGGYQDGAIFILDSAGNLLRRIPAIEIQALLPHPIYLVPTARVSLADGSLIVDYSSRELGTGDPFFRLRLDPEGVAVSPGKDGSLPLGQIAVQEMGGLVIAPSTKEWSVPLVRFAQETEGPRRGFLSLDQNFFNRVIRSSEGRHCVGLASGANGKIWAWLSDTNMSARLTLFLSDGRLDPDFNNSTAPRAQLDAFWEPWIGPSPDGGAFVMFPPRLNDPEPTGPVLKRFKADGSLDPGFPMITLPAYSCGDGIDSWSDLLAPMPDGGLIAPISNLCDFARLRPDGTNDDIWNRQRTSFHPIEFTQRAKRVIAQSDGRLLITYGPYGSRFPRSKLGRLFADGRLDVESFNPPNRFAASRVPTITADGLTTGRWYVLETSDGPDPLTAGFNWWTASEPFPSPPAENQPLKLQLPHPEFTPSPIFWRLKETTAP